MKKIIVLLGMLLVLAGCGSVNFKSSYPSADSYFEHLKEAEGNTDLIEGYIDDSTDSFMVDLYNGSNLFWMADVSILDNEEKEIAEYTTRLVRPQGYYYDHDALAKEPDSYILKKSQFFEFDYPNTSFEYDVIYDIASDYSEEWYDILLEENCSLENVKLAARYQYAVNVVTDTYYYAYYFYDDTMDTYYDQEYQDDYPDTESAVYGAGMDFEAKTIVIYENQDGEWIELETLTME